MLIVPSEPSFCRWSCVDLRRVLFLKERFYRKLLTCKLYSLLTNIMQFSDAKKPATMLFLWKRICVQIIGSSAVAVGSVKEQQGGQAEWSWPI